MSQQRMECSAKLSKADCLPESKCLSHISSTKALTTHIFNQIPLRFHSRVSLSSFMFLYSLMDASVQSPKSPTCFGFYW